MRLTTDPTHGVLCWRDTDHVFAGIGMLRETAGEFRLRDQAIERIDLERPLRICDANQIVSFKEAL